MTCNNVYKARGQAYPRTCEDCGLGPCRHPEYAKPKLTLAQIRNEEIRCLGRLMGVLDAKVVINDEYDRRLSSDPGGGLTFTYTEVIALLDRKYAEIERHMMELKR